jgi:carboxyl-terminal processing protease
MKNKFSVKNATIIAVLLACTSLTYLSARSEPSTSGVPPTNSDTYKALNLFGDVFEQVRANYVEPEDDKKLIEYALNGMLSSLDPHSGYMNEEEAKSMNIQNKGEFGGLGIEVTMENGVIKVVSPIDDTPAARANMQSGDLIVEIDGKPVTGMTLNEAVDKMRGKVGTDITLTVVRQGAKAPLKIKLVRDVIQIQSVKNRVIDNDVGYIRISSFTAQTKPGLDKAFADIKKQTGDKLIGYVLDLRNDPGGLLDQAIAVSNAFLDKGEIVSTRGRNPDDTRRDNVVPGQNQTGNLPVVVLINGGSASASEIVAGALQDNRRAIIVGTQSFGKGSVQTLFNVPGGGMVRLTTARYYTPSGRSIQAKGITPDIIVERAKVVADTPDNFTEIHEADLKGALKNPDGSAATATPPAPAEGGDPTVPESKTGTPATDKTSDKDKKDKEPKLQDDYQLLRGVDVIHGISIYKGDRPLPKPDKDDAKKDDAKKPESTH